MHRFHLDYLKNWANSKTRKPIIIRGARQVGKSTLVKLFAEKNKLKLRTLDFERNPQLKEIFARNDPQEILRLLAIMFNETIKPGEHVLFLDEIQAAPQALQTLRYFYEEIPQLHVLAAGSLLDFTLANHKFSMPVGRIEYMHLGPMSFSEFLLALDEKILLDYLSRYKLAIEIIPVSVHTKLMQLFKTYLIVGGMPEAVLKYQQTNNFIEPERIKQIILSTYKDDFAKYTTAITNNHLRLVFAKIAPLIAKQLKYSQISKEERAATIAQALELLRLAKIIYPVYHSACNGIPLGAEINSNFYKLLFLDIGLLTTQLGLTFLDLTAITEVTLINCGMLAEQFVGQHLLYSKPSYEEPSLYYWTREKKSSQAEVDFVISFKGKVLPIEVKAGKTGTLRSLHYFLQEKELSFGVRFNSELPSITTEEHKLANGKKIQYKLLSLPLYLVEYIYSIME